jgi:hypothetical protein
MSDAATVHFLSPTGYYKVLADNLMPYHGGSGRWRVGRPRSVRGELVPCHNGIHVVSLEQLLRWAGPAIHPVTSISDEIVHDGDKSVARRATIGPAYPTWNERTARLFACDCAERVLPIYEERYPGDERPRRAIETTRRFANGDATREELYAAADAAAYAAAYAAAAYASAAYADYATDEWRWQAQRLGAYLKGEIQ